MGIRLPIETEPFDPPGVADRLLRRTPAQNVFAKAKNAVIAGEFDVALIQNLAAESGVDLVSKFHDRWVALLEEVVVALGSDERYDGTEKEFIARYVKAFAITREEAEGAVSRASRTILKAVVARLVADGDLTPADQEELFRSAKRLAVPQEEVSSIASQVITEIVIAEARSLREDGLVTDDEWERLQRMLTKLSAKLVPGDSLCEELTLAHRRWRTMFGPLEASDCADLTLQRGERVFFRGQANWHEYRKVRQRVDYAGVAGRFRIARGLSFRYGSVGYRAPAVDELTLIRSGDLVMTDKRVILLSTIGDNKSIRWSAVVRVSMESHNTFELEKATGKSPLIDVTSASIGHQFLAAQMAYRLLEESGG